MLSISLTVMSFMTKTLIDIYIYIYIYIYTVKVLILAFISYGGEAFEYSFQSEIDITRLYIWRGWYGICRYTFMRLSINVFVMNDITVRDIDDI